MSGRTMLAASLGAGLGAALVVGVIAGGAVSAGVFALLDLGSGGNSPISPFPILFSGPSTGLSRGRRRAARPPANDIPFWFPDFQDLWSIANIDKLVKWIDQGDGQWEKLARTLMATPGIAALGLFSHLESTVRAPGPQGGGSIESPSWGR